MKFCHQNGILSLLFLLKSMLGLNNQVILIDGYKIDVETNF